MKATLSPAQCGGSETGRAGRRRGLRSDLSRAVVESLELRTLLAADLTCGYVGAIPTALKLTGTNKVTVRLSNVGTTNATGSATVGLFLSTNTTLDAGDKALSPTVTRKVNLKPSAGLNIPVNFASPTGMPDGNYYLLADVTPSSAVGDTNASNDAYASPGTVAVKSAFVDLANSIATPIGGTITIGGKKPKPYNVSVVITNNGNVAAKGPLTENLYGSRDTTLSSSDVLIVTKPLGKVNIAAGKSKKYTLRVVPGSSSPSGTFYLLAHVNPNATVAESDLTNNVTASTGTFVVVNPAVPAGPQIVTDLGSTVSRVVVGSAELSTFTVTLDNAGDTTAVEVDELDASGNSLGKLTDLHDNGSAANGDLVANDGIFTGVNTLGFAAPGTRYFAAVVSDSSLGTPLKGATVPVAGANALTPAQLQADATDASNLFHTADVVIQGGGSAASALSALKAALAADSNVVPSSVRQNSTAISWKNADGIPYRTTPASVSAATHEGPLPRRLRPF